MRLPGSAEHQRGNIINPGFRLRRHTGLRNKNIQTPCAMPYGTGVYGRFLLHGFGVRVDKIENAALVRGAPRGFVITFEGKCNEGIWGI